MTLAGPLPRKLLPQQAMLLSDLTAQVWLELALIAVNGPLTPGGDSPSLLNPPQQWASPPGLNAHVWLLPALT